jgi:hypothetical protein
MRKEKGALFVEIPGSKGRYSPLAKSSPLRRYAPSSRLETVV